MACRAAGHGTIRLHELAIPSVIERRTAALIAWYIPKSSLLMMSTRASGAKPSNRAEGAAADDPPASPAMPPSVTVARGNLQPLTGHGRSWRRGRPALGELTELRVRDIDFPTRMLTVSRAVVEVNAKFHPAGGRFLIKDYPKDGEYRRLKLTSQIVAKLQAYICERGLSDGDLLFAMPERSPTLKMLSNPDRLGHTEPNVAGRTY